MKMILLCPGPIGDEHVGTVMEVVEAFGPEEAGYSVGDKFTREQRQILRKAGVCAMDSVLLTPFLAGPDLVFVMCCTEEGLGSLGITLWRQARAKKGELVLIVTEKGMRWRG